MNTLQLSSCLLLLFPLVVGAQDMLKQNGFKIDRSDNQWIVSASGHEMKIDFTTLPFVPSDCPNPNGEEPDPQIVRSNCEIARPLPVGSTLSPPRLFFALASSKKLAQNMPRVLFEADLARNRVIRVLATAEGGMGSVMISPSGRYLAYSESFSMGVCYVSSFISIADLKGAGDTDNPTPVASLDGLSGSVVAVPLRWTNAHTLMFEKSTYPTDRTCGRHRQEIKSVDVRTLDFSGQQ